MKVFISQPMNGRSNEEILKERKFAECFIKAYYDYYGEDIEIIDSFTKSPELIAKGRIVMLGNSIQLMADADLILFTPDWRTARGCIVEHTVAEEYGLKILYMTNVREDGLWDAAISNLTNTCKVSCSSFIVDVFDPRTRETKYITLTLE